MKKLFLILGLSLALMFGGMYLFSHLSYSENVPCVCAECGWKCGTGHAKTCSSYQKCTPDIVAGILHRVCVEEDTYRCGGTDKNPKMCTKCLRWEWRAPDFETPSRPTGPVRGIDKDKDKDE